MKNLSLIASLLLLTLLASCGPPSPGKQAPYRGVKVGKPYEISGHWYAPGYDEHYDEIGVASWYGPGFHGGHTATGERYDQEDLTAAHRTLPLPSIVRVTNLDNGRSTLLRINDRGPFAHSRIIDLSHAAAVKLGVVRTGTAKVRVQFLDLETREYAANLKYGNAYAMNSLKHVNLDEASRMEEARPDGQPPQMLMAPAMDAVTKNMAFADDETAEHSVAVPSPPVITAQVVPVAAIAPRDEFAMINTDPNSDADESTEPAEQPSPVISTPKTPAKQTRVPVITTGMLYVQAGTFGKKENALHMQNKLNDTGSSEIDEVTIKNKLFYRVLLGPFNMQEDAKYMLSKLTAMGISDAKIIRK